MAMFIRALCLSLAFTALGATQSPARADFDSAADALKNGDTDGGLLEMEAVARGGDPRAQDALATIYLKGVGVTRDVRTAMSWYCMLAHHRRGGQGVMRAVWILAEWFRTGGGVPGQRYNEGKPENEDPLRAYFWFSVMAQQKDLYEEVYDNSVLLGKIGMTRVGRVLYEEEKTALGAAVSRWRPTRSVSTPGRCLEIPGADISADPG
jgi:TPR repeat protein